MTQVRYVAEVVGRVPVCIQLQAPGGRSRFWFDFLFADFEADDLRFELGDDWPLNARVYGGDRYCSLVEGERTRLHPGDLIRVLHPTVPKSRQFTLDAKLADPGRHFDDLAQCGFLEEDADTHTHGLLQILEPITMLRHVPTPASVLVTELPKKALTAFGPTRLVCPLLLTPPVFAIGCCLQTLSPLRSPRP